MNNAKKALALILAMAMAASMAACSTPAAKETEAPAAAETQAPAEAGDETAAPAEATAGGTKIFRYAQTTEPTTLDPSKGNSIADNEVQHAVTMCLVRNTAGDVQPDGAESWEVSEDGMTYTFKIRQGMVWSDGQPVTANDFVYGMKRLADPATGSGYSWILGTANIKNANEVVAGDLPVDELGISAPDESTVVIELSAPTSYFLSLCGTCCQFAALRQDIVEQYGDTFCAKAENQVYCGPFVLKSSDNMVYKFEKNPDYWNADAINFDQVELSIIAEAATQVNMYEAGDLDFVYLPTTEVSRYDDVDHEYLNGNCDYLYFNTQSETQPLMKDANFRLALNYAIDREAYIALATNGVYSASNHITMPLVAGVNGTYGEEYFDTGKIEGYPLKADAEKAKEYLQKAMDAAGITDPASIELHFTTTDNETNKKIAEVCQELLQNNLGIKVVIDQVTYAEIYAFPDGTFAGHHYEIGYGGWGPDFSDPYTYLSLWKSDIGYAGDGTNYGAYVNPEFDALLEASVAETDSQKRMDILAEAEKMLLADGVNMPLQNRMQHYLIDEDVTGVEFYFSAVNIDWVYGDCAAA